MKKFPVIMPLMTVIFIMVTISLCINKVQNQDVVSLSSVSQEEKSPHISTQGKININLATESELTQIPGIGTVLAQRIIQYRTKHGSFATIEEIRNINGISDTKLDSIKDYICLG